MEVKENENKRPPAKSISPSGESVGYRPGDGLDFLRKELGLYVSVSLCRSKTLTLRTLFLLRANLLGNSGSYSARGFAVHSGQPCRAAPSLIGV